MKRSILLIWLLGGSTLWAEDWPQWRGPQRTGVSTETGLLTRWPRQGPPLLWTANHLGGGYATPSIAGGRIYLMGSKEDEEYVHSLDCSTGKLLWSVKIGKVGENRGPNYPGPRSTPTIVDKLLYTLGSDGDLVCLQCDSGKLVWRHHLERDFQGNRGTWAYCESVLIDGDSLICTPGGPVAAMLALDRKTGKVLWKSPLEDGNIAGYASPIVAQVANKKLYVQFLGAGVMGFDAHTGERLWKYRKNVGGVNAMTPIFHAGCIFTSAAGNEDAGGDALLQLVPTDKGVEIKPLYLKANLKNFHGGVVRLGEFLYGTASTGPMCLDFKTGEIKWRARSIGQGSLIAAQGHLYLLNTRGEVALFEATPEEYREKGRFSLPLRSPHPTFAHPVLAGGRLYLRDENRLFCYDIKAK